MKKTKLAYLEQKRNTKKSTADVLMSITNEMKILTQMKMNGNI